MHVHHLRPFPLQPNASPYADVARKKKLDDPNKVPPVRGRFEEENPEERRQQGQQSRSFRSGYLPDAAEEGESFVEPENKQASEPAEMPPAQKPSPLDQLLAGIMGEAPALAAESVPNHVARAERSLDDLLALMRAEPEKP